MCGERGGRGGVRLVDWFLVVFPSAGFVDQYQAECLGSTSKGQYSRNAALAPLFLSILDVPVTNSFVSECIHACTMYVRVGVGVGVHRCMCICVCVSLHVYQCVCVGVHACVSVRDHVHICIRF